MSEGGQGSCLIVEDGRDVEPKRRNCYVLFVKPSFVHLHCMNSKDTCCPTMKPNSSMQIIANIIVSNLGMAYHNAVQGTLCPLSWKKVYRSSHGNLMGAISTLWTAFFDL